jgi:tetratricopeptide (TPR) repeat protein
VLFDLKSGKRRRVVQIVFGFLAFIFFISFVGFGIGSDVSGGIIDAIGLGGNGGSDDASSQYEQQIDEAEKKLEADPKNEQALADLARYRFLSGQENLSFDEATGVATLTEETRSEWNSALDSWERLLKQDPKQVDPQVAGQMVCAYVPPLPVCQVQAPADAIDLGGAAQTQRIVAEQDDGPGGYTQLAAFLFFDGDVKGGQEAADEALARAEPNQRERLQRELDKLEKDAAEYVKAQQAASAGGAEGDEPQLQNPFGGLGGATGIPQAAP